MNKGKKLVKKQAESSKKKKKRWKALDKFNQWCKKRTLEQKKRFSIGIWLFLITLPYQVFQLQTYIASWEVYWNTGAPYRIGAVVFQKDLEKKFIPREHCKEWPFPGYYLKEEYMTGTVWQLKTTRFPHEFLPFPQRVVEMSVYEEDGSLYGIKPGMDMEEANQIMSKHGWKLVKEEKFRDYYDRKSGWNFYFKGGIEICIDETERKAGGIHFSLHSYINYVGKQLGVMFSKIIKEGE